MKKKITIAIINLMPDMKVYQRELLAGLAPVQHLIDIHWIRLESKKYPLQNHRFMLHRYEHFGDVVREHDLDAVIITGAPVELLTFEEVTYWNELKALIRFVLQKRINTLGICWGGLALGKVLGINKVNLEKKYFGVFSLHRTSSELFSDCLPDPQKIMPFSIQASLSQSDVVNLVEAGRLEVLAEVAGLPNAIIGTTDKLNHICLGHPEYAFDRLEKERERDSQDAGSAPQYYEQTDEITGDCWRRCADSMLLRWVANLMLTRRKRLEYKLLENAVG